MNGTAREGATWSPSSTVVDAVMRGRDERPDKIALRYLVTGDVDGGAIEWTYRELDERARSIAAALAPHAARGESALLLFPPELDFVAAFFGCLYAGALAVPAYPPDPSRLPQTLPRLQAICRDAGARVVLTTSAIAGLASALTSMAPDLAGLRWVAVDELEPAPDLQPAPPSPEALAFLQYTSGSTSAPKGVMVSHRNLVANLEMIREGLGVRPLVDSGVSWLPLFHDMGLIGKILETLWIGGTMTLMSPLAFLKQPLRWLRAISHYRASISGGPDFAYDLCARKATADDLASLDLSSWRVASSGAEPVRPATLARFVEIFAPAGFSRKALQPCYGLAEATLFVAGVEPGAGPTSGTFDPEALRRGQARRAEGPNAQALASCGRPPTGCSLLVVEPERRVPLPDGSIGEIWVRGPHVARGYWGNPAASEEAFSATLAGGDAAYLRTGDLGFVERGELYVTGRRKDLVIVNGRNHYPQDVERTAEAASARLRAGCSALFSFERDGREQVVLVAEADGGADELGEAAAKVISAVSEHHQLRLDELVFIRPRTIFKTSSGKLQRSACREAHLSGALEVVHAARAAVAAPALAHATNADSVSAEIADLLIGRVRALSGDPSVGADRMVSSLGIDSMAAARLAGELEKHLGFEVPVEIFFGHTVGQVASLLAEGKPRASSGGAAGGAAAFGDEAALPESLAPGDRRDRGDGPLLLTGATGFLGSYLLSELLERTSRPVICLVRAADEGAALARVTEALSRAGRWKQSYGPRVSVVLGDLAAPSLGLGAEAHADLASTVGAIYHCGAQVHWGAPYAALRAANVGGTRAVFELARSRNIPVHHVSSLGVFPVGATAHEEFSEEGELAGAEHLRVGYFQSKWVADKMAENARRLGFQVSIYRPGFIAGDSVTGHDGDAEGQLFHSFLRGCIELGKVPALEKVLDVVPVDYAAAAIASLSLEPEALGRSFNLVNPAPMRQRDCYAQLRARGWALREVPYAAWRDEVVGLSQRASTNPLVRFSGYYRAVTDERMARLEQQTRARMPFADGNTRALLPSQVRCPPFDAALLGTYLDGYLRRGMLPPPASAAASGPAEAPRAGATLVERYVSDDERLERLYDRGKQRQWDAAARVDWSLDLDPENPQELPDTALPLFGSDVFSAMTKAEKASLRRHFQAWQLSQFMHGEQGALVCAAKVVEQAPTFDAKMFAATQVMDESRHLEAFARLLGEKFELTYPASAPLKTLLGDVVSDSRWDMTMLGMHVLVEGLALAAFSLVRDQSKNPLASSINAYVMEDEARHVAFGRLLLAEHYPRLTAAERDEREEFVVEASYLLRDRFQGDEVWETLGLPVERCQAHVRDSGFLRTYRAQLFSRIVPIIKSIGLFGPRVRKAYGAMGVLGFANVDIDAIMSHDMRAAEQADEARLRGQRGAGEVAP